MKAGISSSCVRVFLFGFQILCKGTLKGADLNDVMMWISTAPVFR